MFLSSGWRNYDVLSSTSAAASSPAPSASSSVRLPYTHWNKGDYCLIFIHRVQFTPCDSPVKSENFM